MKKHSILLFFFLILSPFFLKAYGQRVVYHEYPRICPRSDIYEVKIEGKKVDVYDATESSFVSFESNDAVDVEIRVSEKFRNLNIKPFGLEIEPEIDGQTIRFKLPPTKKVFVESDLGEDLFIYGNAIETDKPDPDAPDVKYFKSGQVYEVGTLILKENETLYIEGGAVLRGQVKATQANNVTIAGLGVIDGGYFKGMRGVRPRTVLIEDSRNTNIQDIIIIESQAWVITLYYCEDVIVDNVKEIAYDHGSDGVDIVSCKQVHVKDCIIKNDDDVIVIKAFKNRYKKYSDIIQNTHLEGVEDVLVSGCILESNEGGEIFEIGQELVTESIKNIKYIDCDVLGTHNHAGVFGIHNSDGAHVTNIVYENIRVDHFYEKLVDFKIIETRYTEEDERGTISNVFFKDIFVNISRYNPGYSISIMLGHDKEYNISNVTFDNLQFNGKKITSADEMTLLTKYVEKLTFK